MPDAVLADRRGLHDLPTPFDPYARCTKCHAAAFAIARYGLNCGRFGPDDTFEQYAYPPSSVASGREALRGEH